MKDNFVHIALAANHRYVKGLNATFVSMINAASDKHRLKFHIFDDGLTEADRAFLVELGERFGYNESVDFKLPDMQSLKTRFREFHGSHSPVLRLFFPDLLSELSWVLWADVDTLWFRDPISLWEERDESVSLLWSRDIPSTRRVATKNARWRPNRDEFRYACSGVVLMNLTRMRASNFVPKCMDFVDNWGTPMFPDQDILNEICYDDSKFVDERWDCMYPTPNVEDGVVLHFNCIGHLFEEGVCKGFSPLFEIWFRYYRQVVEGISDAQVCPLWKRGCYNLIALLHPVQKVFAYCFDPIHPWISDFVQRMIFFSWVRRKRLWI